MRCARRASRARPSPAAMAPPPSRRTSAPRLRRTEACNCGFEAGRGAPSPVADGRKRPDGGRPCTHAPRPRRARPTSLRSRRLEDAMRFKQFSTLALVLGLAGGEAAAQQSLREQLVGTWSFVVAEAT